MKTFALAAVITAAACIVGWVLFQMLAQLMVMM